MPDEEYHREIAEELAKYVQELIRGNTIEKEDVSILVVGLGNRQVTPDALGPNVVDHLTVTRHIVKEYGKYAMGMENANMISAIVPGVMGQTGMETVEIIRGVIKETKPDLVIAVDAVSYTHLVKTMRKHQHIAFFQIRLNILLIKRSLFLIIDQNHDNICLLCSFCCGKYFKSLFFCSFPRTASFIKSDDHITSGFF